MPIQVIIISAAITAISTRWANMGAPKSDLHESPPVVRPTPAAHTISMTDRPRLIEEMYARYGGQSVGTKRRLRLWWKRNAHLQLPLFPRQAPIAARPEPVEGLLSPFGQKPSLEGK